MQAIVENISTKYTRAVILGALTIAALAVYWSLRLAVASWFELGTTLDDAWQAIALAPGNEEYLRRAAELTEEAGGDGTAYYKMAVTVDPHAANDWVQLGFHAERDGRHQEEEEDLLKAVHVDHSFQTQWILANFYFRRGDASNTLYWIRKTLSVGEGDLMAVFRLCWQATGDPDLISRRAIPNRPAVLAQYLEFLFSADRFRDSTAIAGRLLGIASANQVGALLDYCDRALAAGSPDQAARVWNALSRRGLIAEAAIDDLSAHQVRNPDFHAPLTGRGFDWKWGSPAGTSHDSGGADGLRMEFSGKQADECVLLSQYVRLTPETRGVLTARYQSQDIASATGLRWRILNVVTRKDIEDASLELPSGNTEQASTEFMAPPDSHWGLLQLLYNRRPGTSHIAGSLRLIRVDIVTQK